MKVHRWQREDWRSWPQERIARSLARTLAREGYRLETAAAGDHLRALGLAHWSLMVARAAAAGSFDAARLLGRKGAVSALSEATRAIAAAWRALEDFKGAPPAAPGEEESEFAPEA